MQTGLKPQRVPLRHLGLTNHASKHTRGHNKVAPGAFLKCWPFSRPQHRWDVVLGTEWIPSREATLKHRNGRSCGNYSETVAFRIRRWPLATGHGLSAQ